jgi:hypothetical protein
MKKLLPCLALYALSVGAIAMLYPHPIILSVAMAILAVLAWRLDPKPGDLLYLVAAAVFGPLAEAVAIARGAWTYADPDFLGIPLWLPVGWGLAYLLLKRLSEAFGGFRGQV